MLNVIKQLKIDKRIRVGYRAAFLLLLIPFLLTLYANKQLMEQTKTINRTNSILFYLEELISGLKDSETGVRSYFLIKDKILIEMALPFYKKISKDKSMRKYKLQD